ncbi:hypothetical protein [Azospirillum sp. TSH64]|uniref:hypothetical protein n=1 Tax=Azospirillum sp. TSH64 TaxID=652740 RepID=UPI000D68B753|nr:hypothetical protein [Azospirillum sp. TSH64]
MELNELPPKDGAQRAYCDICGGPLDLIFERFHVTVSGIEIDIDGLPMLECTGCSFRTLPDRSRFSIMQAHEITTKKDATIFKSKRKKIEDVFDYTDVPFQYDPDDYYYYPGLARPWNLGFLTPIFFNRTVLTKYDADPRYLIRYASPTYGNITYMDDFAFPFGINRHGHLIMWLGDIAKLPKSEQYYLMSENRPSDHSLGSEFYDGQIECKFTDPPQEDILFKERSNFLAAAFKRWGEKIAHLDTEVLDLARRLHRPVHDTPAQRHSTSDTLNKIHLESLNNAKLGEVVATQGIVCTGTGSLKRLQALLSSVGDATQVNKLMSPFYTLYDFRVAYSHLGSTQGAAATMRKVTDRLGLMEEADLQTIYNQLLLKMTASYTELIKILENKQPSDTSDGGA